MRPSSRWFCFLAGCALLVFVLGLEALTRSNRDRERLEGMRKTVEDLHLTDICLFTEARYTRHPSLADLHSPFQDHPAALEHFPSGSFVQPASPLRHPYAQRD